MTPQQTQELMGIRPTLEQVKLAQEDLGYKLNEKGCEKILSEWDERLVTPTNLTLFIINWYYNEEISNKAMHELIDIHPTLDKSRELLASAYKLFLEKQRLIKELNDKTIAITEEMEACIHFAFEELPSSHDPEDWLLIDKLEGQKGVICKWVDPSDMTHIVDFRIIH